MKEKAEKKKTNDHALVSRLLWRKILGISAYSCYYSALNHLFAEAFSWPPKFAIFFSWLVLWWNTKCEVGDKLLSVGFYSILFSLFPFFIITGMHQWNWSYHIYMFYSAIDLTLVWKTKAPFEMGLPSDVVSW